MASPDKREAILRATMQLIEAHGFHGTSMAMVAKEAGVAAGTIYLYFKSKDELIDALYVQQRDALQEMLPPAEGLFKTRFVKTYRALVDYFVAHPAAFGFLEQYINSPFMRDETRSPQHALQALLKSGQQNGILRNQDLSLMCALVYGHLSALARLQLRGNKLALTAIQDAAQACWESIRMD